MGIIEVTETATVMPLPWQMIFYLAVGTVDGIVVSLFTRPTEAEKIERYYALQRTPVLEVEEPSSEACQLPEGAKTLPRKVFFPDTDLEISIPSKRSVTGFAIGWVCVISIILFVYWISLG